MGYSSIICRIVTALAVLSVCSGDAEALAPLPLPPDVAINEGAGHGDVLLVMLRVGSKGGLSFLVDTGSPLTILDTSLEPQLGKPCGKARFNWMYGRTTHRLFRAPEIYLGDVRLATGGQVATVDFARMSADLKRVASYDHRLMGILGMDCLRHYCIQLDFIGQKMRFLNRIEGESTQELGQAFPLNLPNSKNIYIRARFMGRDSVRFLVDTGTTYEADLTPGFFQQWTNHASAVPIQEGSCPSLMFGGHLYATHRVQMDRKANSLGLGFLALNLVTFDFPRKTLYLKPAEMGLNPHGK